MSEAAEMRRHRRAITPEMPIETLPQLLTFAEVAAWTQKDAKTVYRWVNTTTARRRKKLKTVRVGGSPMVRRGDLQAFLS